MMKRRRKLKAWSFERHGWWYDILSAMSTTHSAVKTPDLSFFCSDLCVSSAVQLLSLHPRPSSGLQLSPGVAADLITTEGLTGLCSHVLLSQGSGSEVSAAPESPGACSNMDHGSSTLGHPRQWVWDKPKICIFANLHPWSLDDLLGITAVLKWWWWGWLFIFKNI